jgi:hypothetical protein
VDVERSSQGVVRQCGTARCPAHCRPQVRSAIASNTRSGCTRPVKVCWFTPTDRPIYCKLQRDITAIPDFVVCLESQRKSHRAASRTGQEKVSQESTEQENTGTHATLQGHIQAHTRHSHRRHTSNANTDQQAHMRKVYRCTALKKTIYYILPFSAATTQKIPITHDKKTRGDNDLPDSNRVEARKQED